MKKIVFVVIFVGLATILLLSNVLFPLLKVQFPKIDRMYVLADIPMLNDSEYVVVPISIASKEYKFIVDTGCTHSIIDRSLKPLCADLVKVEKRPIGIEQVEMKVEYYKLSEKLKIGNIAFGGIVACVDFSQFGIPSEYHYDGIIGMNILSDKVVQFDFEKKRVLLLKTPFLTGANDFNDKWGHPVQLSMDINNSPNIRLQLSGTIDELFLIDTGCRLVNYLHESSFDQLLLEEKIETATAKFPDKQENAAIVPEVYLSDIKIQDMVFVSGDRSQLGTCFLKRFKMLTSDFEDNDLYLKLKEPDDNGNLD